MEMATFLTPAALLIFLFIHGVRDSAAQEDPVNFYIFDDCSATSTQGPDYDPRHALQPGTGYWSSAGGLPDDEEAAYDEELYFLLPEEAEMISVTMRKQIHGFYGINEIRPIGAGKPLLMLISGITSPAGYMCLQVEAGKVDEEGADVVLESCEAALAAADGRELWQSNPQMQLVAARSRPPKCMTLQDGLTDGVFPYIRGASHLDRPHGTPHELTDGGKIVLSDCMRAMEEGDGRSLWSFQGNSQLRLERAGSWCLSQKDVNGSTAGVGDIVESSGATATASSTANSEAHGADKAIDKDTDTYWQSGSVELGLSTVSLTLDLGKPSKLSSIRIQWEYPALSYAILTSEDGKEYKEQASNRANPSVDTLDELGTVKAQYIEIRMLKPHPRLGEVAGKYFYAISAVQVFANRLRTAVAPCTQAANSDDARDKYFIEYVTHFYSSLAKRLCATEDDVLARQNALDARAEQLQELFPKMENCHKEKLLHEERLSKAIKQADAISAEIFLLGGIAPHHYNAAAHAKPASEVAGDRTLCRDYGKVPVRRAVAEYFQPDCFSHGIMPQCTSEPLRAYCDMNTGSSIYVWNGKPPRNAGATLEDVASPEDVRQRCAEVGLEPMVIKSPSHFTSISAVLYQMGYHLNGRGFVPLAFDYSCFDRSTCSGYFQDMNDGAADLTALLLLQSDPESVKVGMNTAGLGTDGAKVSFFDITAASITAVVCSTNTMEGESTPSIEIACDTTAENHEVFKGIVNTNVVAACPEGCATEEEWSVYGSEGVYSATSSICRAAIHAGLIQNGGLVNVSLESPRMSYEGSKQNGVSSSALELSSHGGAPGSFRVGPLMKVCPVAANPERTSSTERAPPARQTATSFLETAAFAQISTPANKQPPFAFSYAGKKDYNIHEALERTTQLIDRMHGIDPEIVVVAKKNAGEAVGNARKHLKPAEKLQQAQDSRSLGVYMETEALTAQLLNETGETYETLEQLKYKLQNLEEELVVQKGFESFEIKENTPSVTRFSDLFVTFDSPRARHGPSSWGYSLMPVGGTEATFGQSTAIAGVSDIDGTYAMLRGKRFFDSMVLVDINALGSGTLGISFKMRDFSNMYLLWMNQKQGLQRLLKIENGVSAVLAERKDGGYIQGKWFHVRIETRRGLIKVDMGESETMEREVFSTLDQRFAAGSVGFFSSGMEGGVFFRKLRVDAMDCIRPQKTVPPAPPRCALFRETYTGNPMLLYRKYDATEAAGASGAWEYEADVGGREKVLVQINAVRGPAEIGTNLILHGNRVCKNGYYSFEFFPQCTGGIVGGIFRFSGRQQYNVVELGAGELRIRSITNGQPRTAGSVPAPMRINEWHRIEINFEGPSVIVKLEVAGTSLTLSREDFFGNDPRDGLVGLSAYNCGGVAFDNIVLAPYQLETIIKQSSVFFSAMTTNAKAWESCTAKVTTEDRRQECQEMFPKDPIFLQSECMKNYCKSCCVYHTSLLSRSHQLLCERRCTAKATAAVAFIGEQQQQRSETEQGKEWQHDAEQQEHDEQHHQQEDPQQEQRMFFRTSSALDCVDGTPVYQSQCKSGDFTCRREECSRCCAAGGSSLASSSSKDGLHEQEDMRPTQLNDGCVMRCEEQFAPEHVEL